MAEFVDVIEKWGEMCRSMCENDYAIGCSRCRLNKNICDKLIREYNRSLAEKAERDIIEWSDRNMDGEKKPTWADLLVRMGVVCTTPAYVVREDGTKTSVPNYILSDKIEDEIPDEFMDLFYGEEN